MKILPCTKQNISFKASKQTQNKKVSLQNIFEENKKVFESGAGALLLGGILFALTKKPSAIKNLNGKTILSSEQAAVFKKQMKAFAADIDYRKDLLKALKIKTDDYAILRPIAGPVEYKYILKEFHTHPEYYSPGETLVTSTKDGFDMSGKLKHKFRASLHNHTLYSDGAVSVQERLDEAVKYADESAESLKNNPAAKAKNAPFTIAITDHDTLEGCKEAVKIISSDPWKYRNLRVVLGCELTCESKMIPQELKKPVSVHMLVHGINPFDEALNKFINSKKSAINEFGLCPGDMEEAMELMKKQKYGYMGIAHPGLINIGESLKNPAESLQGMSDSFKAFKNKGGEKSLFAEIHYHYFGSLADSPEWLNNMEKFAKENKLYFSGGMDSHGSSIFYSGI